MSRFVHHREHTILLSGDRVDKGTKRKNSLPLFPVVISYATLQINCYLQVLPNAIWLNLYLGLSALGQKIFGLHINIPLWFVTISLVYSLRAGSLVWEGYRGQRRQRQPRTGSPSKQASLLAGYLVYFHLSNYVSGSLQFKVQKNSKFCVTEPL